jgi:hypothetical protein
LNPYHEHEFEAAPGLPESLPVNERVLWQGAPSAFLLAVYALHARKLLMYFGVMLALQAVYLSGEPGMSIWPSVALSASLSGVCLLLLAGVAWYAARNTLYTLTNRRVVMRIGMVLTITLNIPLKQIESADVRTLQDGSGDLALGLKGPRRVGWLHLWPHAKAWTLRHPQPALRCVTDVQQVAALFMQAWIAENPQACIQRGALVVQPKLSTEHGHMPVQMS